MVEKGYSGGELGSAAAVEIDAHGDPRFARRPLDSRLARRGGGG
jgi:hypothetical protein